MRASSGTGGPHQGVDLRATLSQLRAQLAEARAQDPEGAARRAAEYAEGRASESDEGAPPTPARVLGVVRALLADDAGADLVSTLNGRAAAFLRDERAREPGAAWDERLAVVGMDLAKLYATQNGLCRACGRGALLTVNERAPFQATLARTFAHLPPVLANCAMVCRACARAGAAPAVGAADPGALERALAALVSAAPAVAAAGHHEFDARQVGNALDFVFEAVREHEVTAWEVDALAAEHGFLATKSARSGGEDEAPAAKRARADSGEGGGLAPGLGEGVAEPADPLEAVGVAAHEVVERELEVEEAVAVVGEEVVVQREDGLVPEREAGEEGLPGPGLTRPEGDGGAEAPARDVGALVEDPDGVGGQGGGERLEGLLLVEGGARAQLAPPVQEGGVAHPEEAAVEAPVEVVDERDGGVEADG